MDAPVSELKLVFAAADEAAVRRALDEGLQSLRDPAASLPIDVNEDPSLVVDPITGTIIVALIGLSGVVIGHIVDLVKHRDLMAIEKEKLGFEGRRVTLEEQKLAADEVVRRIQAVQDQYGVVLTGSQLYVSADSDLQ